MIFPPPPLKFLLSISLAFSLSGCSSLYSKSADVCRFDNNTLSGQVNSDALANSLISCENRWIAEGHDTYKAAKDIAEEDKILIEQAEIIKRNVLNWETYLNATTPPQQITYFPAKPQATGTCSLQYSNTHPEIGNAETDADGVYMAKNLVQILLSPSFLLAYKLDKEAAENMKQGNIYQASQKASQASQIKSQLFAGVKMVINNVIAYQKAAAEAAQGNYTDIIAIYAQMQPKKWSDYFVGCFQLEQKYHLKATVIRD